ncbi:MAG TPA: hypothetical protein VGE40_09985 [Bacilli bacterium]
MSQENVYHFSLATGRLKEQAIQLHHERYVEVGFFEKNETDPYQNFSTYFTSQTGDDSKVVGVIRLISKKLDELPTIQNFTIYDIEKARLHQLDKTRYAEISAFTKMPQHDVGLGLIKTALQYSLDCGISHWICCIDERAYNYMHRMFKFPFKTVGVTQVYLGSISIPCTLNLKECLDTLQETRPQLYDYLTTLSEEKKQLEVVR